jgi:hypothetical protein
MLKLSTLVLASTVAPTVVMSAAAVTAPSRLPFLENDFARARIAATRRQLPLFVEVWAPW